MFLCFSALLGSVSGVPRDPLQTRAPTTSCPDPDAPGFEGVLELRARLKEQGFTSDRPIVIGAGEGTTGTRTLHTLTKNLGLRTVHCMYCRNSHLYEKESGARMIAIHPSNYSTTDWPAFLTKFDAIFDTPVAELFPVLIAAFPNARVVRGRALNHVRLDFHHEFDVVARRC